MATEQKDIQRVDSTASNLLANLIDGQLGFQTDGERKMIHKAKTGADFKYFTPDGHTPNFPKIEGTGDADTYIDFQTSDNCKVFCGGVEIATFDGGTSQVTLRSPLDIEQGSELIQLGFGSSSGDYVLDFAQLPTACTLDIDSSVVVRDTLVVSNLPTGSTDSVIINSSGTLQKRTISSQVWSGGLIAGSGTTNYIPKFTASDTVGDSQLVEVSGDIGNGIATPGYKFHTYEDTNGAIGGANENPNAGTSGAALTSTRAENAVVDVTCYSSTHSGGNIMGQGRSNMASILSFNATNFVAGTFGLDPFILGTNNTEAMRIDSSQRTGIGEDNPGCKLDVKDSSRFVSQITSTDAGAAAGPYLTLYRNSSSPSNNDLIGGFRFQGENSIAANTDFGLIICRMDDITDGSEDGSFIFQPAVSGTTTTKVVMNGTGLGVGDSPTTDFEVKKSSSGDIAYLGDGTNTYVFETGTNTGEYKLDFAQAASSATLTVDGSLDVDYNLEVLNFVGINTSASAANMVAIKNNGSSVPHLYLIDNDSTANMDILFGNASSTNTMNFNSSETAANTKFVFDGEVEANQKVKMTAEGGIAIRLTNREGSAITKGQLVKADSANDDSVVLTDTEDFACFGVVYDSSIADDAAGWIVISGIADVAMGDNENATRGYWVKTNDDEGAYAENQSSPDGGFFSDDHNQEIGHCIETVSAGGAGTHILARCVLHFN